MLDLLARSFAITFGVVTGLVAALVLLGAIFTIEGAIKRLFRKSLRERVGL